MQCAEFHICHGKGGVRIGRITVRVEGKDIHVRPALLRRRLFPIRVEGHLRELSIRTKWAHRHTGILDRF